jgi:ABC-type sugar transport system substrate-binding protein
VQIRTMGRLTASAAAVLAASGALAACGSSSSSSSGSSGGSSAAGSGSSSGSGSASASATSSKSANSSGGSSGKKTIYYVSPLIADANWFRFNTCLTKSAQNLGYNTKMVGPASGVNIPENIQEIEQAILTKPNLLIVSVLNPSSYAPAIKKARAAGIPVISTVVGGGHTGENAYIGLNWKLWGQKAADIFAKSTGGAPHLGIIAAGTSFTNQIEGINALKAQFAAKYPNAKVDDIEYSGSDPAKALTEAGAMLEAHPDINAMWNATGGTDSVSMVKAVAAAGRTGKVKILAGDLLPEVADEIKAGTVVGSTLQVSCLGGTATANLANKMLKGEKVPYNNTYPVPFVTKANLQKYVNAQPQQ